MAGEGPNDETGNSPTSRRGFLRSLVVKAIALPTAGSVLWTEEVDVPERPRLPKDRDKDVQEPQNPKITTHRKDKKRELSGQAPLVHVPFDATDYDQWFTDSPLTRYNRIVNSREGGSQSLQVAIPEGNHYGTSMHYRFVEAGMAEPTELLSRYYLYVPSTVELEEGDSGKLPGPAGTYGEAGWGGHRSDGTNGWSARMSFECPDDGNSIQLSSYVYHAEMDGSFGSHFRWDIGEAGRIKLDKWYRIDNYVRMNTPGENDGTLRGWVNGVLALDETSLRFRDVERLKIEEYWFNVYYGGFERSPADNEIHFRNLRLWPFYRDE